MTLLIWNRARGFRDRHIVTAVRDGVWIATFFNMHDAKAWCADQATYRI